MQQPDAAVLTHATPPGPSETEMVCSMWHSVRALRAAVDFDNAPDAMVSWMLPDGHKTTVEMGPSYQTPGRY
jgi:hypothetical protein